MDFARKQLEKYGWTAGKGLGKYENGISEALKPKIKRSMTGVGHDPAADFTEHWWDNLYNKAAENLEVEEENGKVKKIKRKNSSDFEITNNAWQIKKKKKGKSVEEQYSDYFVNTAILRNDGIKLKSTHEAGSDEEEPKKNLFKISDDELFAACEGRTAHKGARHGLKALGKLARIEQQEKMLLNQSKYNGYSHAKRENKMDPHAKNVSQVTDNTNDVDIDVIKKKKKKKKHGQLENEIEIKDNSITAVNIKQVHEHSNINSEVKLIKESKLESSNVDESDNISHKKLKVKKNKIKHNIEQLVVEKPNDESVECEISKTKKHKIFDEFGKIVNDVEAGIIPSEQCELHCDPIKTSKKKKRKKDNKDSCF